MIIYKKHSLFSHVEAFLKEHIKEYDDTYVCVLGYLLCDYDELIRIKQSGKKLIIYQLEQISNHLYSHNNRWFDMLKTADIVFEYDISNKNILLSFGIDSILLPLKYTKSLKIVKNTTLDIDVLFYGALNEKRENLLSSILKTNDDRRIVISQNLFGEELDEYISRSKIILNCHYYDMDIQEQVRIFYPLINGKVVVSEYNTINHFGDSIFNVKREYISNHIKTLLSTVDDFSILGNYLRNKYQCL